METTYEIEGMPQNVYTQIIGALAILFGKNSEIELGINTIQLVQGCTIVIENGKLKIKGFSNG